MCRVAASLLSAHHCGDSAIAPVVQELLRVVVWHRARPANVEMPPQGVGREIDRAGASHPPAAEHPVQRGGRGEEHRVPEQIGDEAVRRFWNYGPGQRGGQ